MIIRLPWPAVQPRVLLQRAGYHEFLDPNTGETSFVRRLGTHFYPRFHLYPEQEGEKLRLNLHLDQKKPSYQGFRKHSGEYDGPTVEAESERLYQLLNGAN